MAFNKKIKSVPSIDQRGPYAVYEALMNKATAAGASDAIKEEYNGTKWFCTDAKGSAHYGEIWFRGVKYASDHVIVADIQANVAVGAVEVGETFAANTSIEAILNKILKKDLMTQPFTIKANSGLRYTGSDQQLVSIDTALSQSVNETEAIKKAAVYYSKDVELTKDNYSTGSTDITSIVASAPAEYTVYFYVTEDLQYAAKSGSVNVTIGRQQVAMPTNVEHVYDGNQYSLATSSLYSWSATVYSTDVTTITATATLGDTDNYEWSDGTIAPIERTLKITQATPAPTISVSSWTWSSAVSTPSITGKTGDGTQTMYYRKSGATDWTLWDAVVSESDSSKKISTEIPGTYQFRLTITETTNYKAYDNASSPVQFTINKIAQSPKVNVASISAASQSGTVEITISNLGGSGNAATVASSNTAVATVSEIQDNKFTVSKLAAGTSTITVTQAGNEYYSAGTATISVSLSNYCYYGFSTDMLTLSSVNVLNDKQGGEAISGTSFLKEFEAGYKTIWVAVLTSIYKSGVSIDMGNANTPDTESATTVECGDYTLFGWSAPTGMGKHSLTIETK